VIKVALTGGIGSGKSQAGEFFRQLGAIVVDADELAREVIARGTDGFNELVATFGDEILLEGSLDRKRLAEIVFNDAIARKKLEQIIHPRVQVAFNKIAEASPKSSVIIYQIPILVETQVRHRFDYVITVETELATRILRLKARGLEAHEIDARLKVQADDLERAKVADQILDNNGDPESLLRQIEDIYSEILLPRAAQASTK
jgi:dephospho-CoA kinase